MIERQAANHLKEIRDKRGLTQLRLAELAGLSRKTINTIENRVFIPSVVTALVLAEVLEISVEELFFLER